MSRKNRILKALGLDDAVEALFGVRPRSRRAPAAVPSQNPLAVQLKRATEQPRRALPPPPKPLALPPPDPAKQLPPLASKPRGGQWWTKATDAAISPDEVARRQASDLSYRFMDFTPEEEGVVRMGAPVANEVQDWLARSLAKYYKTDFGSPGDPLRDLAERGLHYDPEMTPEKWNEVVNSYLLEDQIGDILLPPNRLGGMPGAGSDLRGDVMVNMPWLAKQPVTDKIYGIWRGGLDIEHFADEFANALDPEMSGLPMDLAVRRESLGRMTFPQAVERVGRINQFRVRKMQEEAAAALNNPAIQTFKEYPDAGYRWVELRAPDYGDQWPEGYRMSDPITIEDGRQAYEVLDPRGAVLADYFDPEEALRMTQKDAAFPALQQALRFEGDTMGHCVGGYCDDVMSGRSRIYSLRDAKGQPHVTVEASPRGLTMPPDVYNQLGAQARDEMELRAQAGEFGDDFDLYDQAIVRRERELRDAWKASQAELPMDIVQIKGKQNRAPNDEYLPYVQDFVKSGTWGNIGDLGNTGLVKLPDGRYVTQQQYDEALDRAVAGGISNPSTRTLNPEGWQSLSPFFEGYAVGGRVDRNRCFSRHPLSVR